MKVVHLIPALNKGGTERLVISLTQRQLELGIEVILVSFSDVNFYSNETEGIKVLFFPKSYIRYRFLANPQHNLFEFKTFLLSFKPDIIHSHSYWTDLLIYGLKLKGPKYISHFHLYYKEYLVKKSFTLNYFRSFYDKYNLLLNFWLRKAKFILISKDITVYYKKLFPKNFHSSFYYIPNAINIKPSTFIKSKISEPIRLFTAGRLVEVKNHAFLLKVMTELVKKKIDFELSIAGDGPLLAELEGKIKDLKLENKVKLLGNVDNIYLLYDWCDIYVHTATSETFGLTILEAMAHGKPCICIKAGGNEDLIINEVDGILLEKDVLAKGFAEKICEIKNDAKLYNSIAKAALDKSKLFQMNEYAEKILELYKN